MRLPLIALIASLACTLPAHAQQCTPLQRAFDLDLIPIPGTSRFALPVTVNGVPKRFVLSTREFSSRLSRQTVTDMNLRPRTQGRMLSAQGTVSNAQLVSVDLQIGLVKADGQEMVVMEDSGPVDGMFGPNLMQRYDFEFDFAGRKLSYFLTDHCEGRVVHWTTTPHAVVPFTGWTTGSAQRSMTIPVTIDGHDIRAEIDTSLAQSVMDADTANSLFSVTPDSEGAVPQGTFKQLQIGGLNIPNPRLRVEPDLIGSRTRDALQANSRVQRRTDNFLPSLRLGMDILSRLHLYLAAKEGKLYLTPASAK